jgi:hypothetical protein
MTRLEHLAIGATVAVTAPYYGTSPWTVAGGTTTRRYLTNDRGGRLEVRARKGTGHLYVVGAVPGSYRLEVVPA